MWPTIDREEGITTPSVSCDPTITTAGVLEALRASGKPLREWGRAVDGTPLLAVQTGGEKQPAIFVTAGAHATETAGVHAALNLLHVLSTDHEVHILPLRDPLGFDGVDRCLSFATGRRVEVADHRSALDFLLDSGKLLWREEGMYLIKLGEMGFFWTAPRKPGVQAFLAAHSRMLSFANEAASWLRPLWGRRVLFMNAMSDVEGTGEKARCWQGVISTKGEYLHLNRFFGRDDAPPEVAAVDRLMHSVRPGLTCDLHEGNGSGFWMPIRRPEKDSDLVFKMTHAYFDYIRGRGYPVTTYEEWAATDETFGKHYTVDWMKPEPRLPGMFWTQGLLRGEGYGLLDYAGLFGIGYGTEAPMERPLRMRVDGITNGIAAAIRVWEDTVRGCL